MAYLKGNTYIDGNLYVDGSLRVQSLSDSQDNSLPYLESDESSVTNRLVKFTSTDGELSYSKITETLSNTSTTTYSLDYTLESDSSTVDTLNINTDKATTVNLFTQGNTANPFLNINTYVSKTEVNDSTLIGLYNVGSTIPTSGVYYLKDGVYYSSVAPSSTTTVRTVAPDMFYYESLCTSV